MGICEGWAELLSFKSFFVQNKGAFKAFQISEAVLQKKFEKAQTIFTILQALRQFLSKNLFSSFYGSLIVFWYPPFCPMLPS